jgi:hypothetical protein
MSGTNPKKKNGKRTERAFPGWELSFHENVHIPVIARLHHRYCDDPQRHDTHDKVADKIVLAAKALKDDSRTKGIKMMVAGAGFASLRLSKPTAKRKLSPEEFKQCKLETEEWLRNFDKSVGSTFTFDFLFGLDLCASYQRNKESYNSVTQFIVFRPAGSENSRLIASKRYRSVLETNRLCLKANDIGLPKTVQTKLGNGELLGLVCHEAIAFHPRGKRGNSEIEGQKRRSAIQESILTENAAYIFNAIHALPLERSFKTSHGKILEKKTGVKIISAFGSLKEYKPGKKPIVPVDEEYVKTMASNLNISNLSYVELFPTDW